MRIRISGITQLQKQRELLRYAHFESSLQQCIKATKDMNLQCTVDVTITRTTICCLHTYHKCIPYCNDPFVVKLYDTEQYMISIARVSVLRRA